MENNSLTVIILACFGRFFGVRLIYSFDQFLSKSYYISEIYEMENITT